MALFNFKKGLVKFRAKSDDLKRKLIKSRIKFNSNIYIYSLLMVVLPVVTIKLLGLLQPFELASYDLQFYFKPIEEADNRIVIVEYDEKSIQLLQESSMSDLTLVSLLDRIIEQKPRIIGLDLYRDFSVPAPKATKKDNEEAYENLNRIFSSYPKIIGIEKSLPPKVNPPAVLKNKEKVAASDLPIDPDFRVRRTYIYPALDEDNYPRNPPYIGVTLGYRYLEADNWQADKARNGLGIRIFKQSQEVVLRPLNNTIRGIGFPVRDDSWDMLINWRKTKNGNNFSRISVSELLNKSILPDLFRDRLVIIGVTTGYSSDSHTTSITRWKRWTQTDGVEIVAHVASSIVNAAIEGRNLINPAPSFIEYFLLILPIIGLAKITEDKINTTYNLFLSELRFFTALYCLFFSFFIILISLIMFRLGWWLNIIPSLSATILSWLVTNYYYQSKKEKDEFYNLVTMMDNLNHKLHSISYFIHESSTSVIRARQEIVSEIQKDLVINGIAEQEIFETNFAPSLIKLLEDADNIKRETFKIDRYTKRTSEFLTYTYPNEKNIVKVKNFNIIVKQTIQNFLIENNYTYHVNLEENYDNTLLNYGIYKESVEVLVENLVDNAFYAVNPVINKSKSHIPKVKISTINYKKAIQIIVEDNGAGIPKKYQKKIFLMGISYKDGGGSGTGLYLVSRIVKHWKGSLKLESEINKGSRFTISLPKID